MKPWSEADVEGFYLELHSTLNILRARDRFVQPKSAYTLQAAASKLTNHLLLKWAQNVFDIRPREATLKDLVLTNRLVQPVESSNVTRYSQQTTTKGYCCRSNVAAVLDNHLEYELDICERFWRFNSGMSEYEFSSDRVAIGISVR
ncbi:hypothetical protein TTRE_0000908601 [Trichuris trichiura]|uniref:Uncharacterized protein n=1 Tax=Trichuris trichiura TaxID=36087 RepID=A0A077ZPN1_TRITR|nr:hypothetical protein TTRE_0000908601 [Trichuris trichiura]